MVSTLFTNTLTLKIPLFPAVYVPPDWTLKRLHFVRCLCLRVHMIITINFIVITRWSLIRNECVVCEVGT
jgi:hypothetical protein